MQYDHTQESPLHLFDALIAPLLVLAWLLRADPIGMFSLIGVAAVIFFVSLSMRYLTVSDEGDDLSIRYGPLPIFRKRIPYSSITAVEADRSSILDGWGIHYVPGRGWTYNLWGFDCVKLSLGRKTVRIGSDDVENLVEFLRRRIQPSA